MPKITAAQIAAGNDLFRTTFFPSKRHKVLLTPSVAESPSREDIISAIRSFTQFTKENDPHGEHDFGKVEVDGESYFFKIDYYDESYEYGADPYEGYICRVMTIMRSDEY